LHKISNSMKKTTLFALIFGLIMSVSPMMGETYYHAIAPNFNNIYECYGAYTHLFNRAAGNVVGNLNDTQTWITGSCASVAGTVYTDQANWLPSSKATPTEDPGRGYVKLVNTSNLTFRITNCTEVSILASGHPSVPVVFRIETLEGTLAGTEVSCTTTNMYSPTEVNYSTALNPEAKYTVKISSPNTSVGDPTLFQIRFKAPSGVVPQAEAGDDKHGESGAATALDAAPAPTGYTGTWSIKSGGTGTFGSVSDPKTTFSAGGTGVYVLVWTITDGVNSSSDEMCFYSGAYRTISLNMNGGDFAIGKQGQWKKRSLADAENDYYRIYVVNSTYYMPQADDVVKEGSVLPETNAWCTPHDGCGAPGEGFSAWGNLTFTAQWELSGPFHLTYDANGATSGVVPAAVDTAGSIRLARNTGELAKEGKYFGGWNTKADGLGACYKEGMSFYLDHDTILYAQWDNQGMPVQDVQDVQGVAVNDRVTFSWHIPGIVPLDRAMEPIAWFDGYAEYTYNKADTTLEMFGYGNNTYDQTGVAFPVKSDQVTYIEYEYSASALGAYANLWAGVVMDPYTAYWEYKQPFGTDHTLNVWHSVTATPNRTYFDGAYVDNPIEDEAQQVAIFVNFGEEQGGNAQRIKFRNIRYHIADSADVAEVVVVRKANSVPTLENYEKKWDGLGLTFDFVDDDIKTLGNTYYYTIYTISVQGVVSAGITRSFTIEEHSSYSVTYDANGGIGVVPEEEDKVAGEEFALKAAPQLYKQGYRLTAWVYDGTEYAVGETITMPDNAITLTAKWEKYIVPQVQHLAITDPEPDNIPLSWDVYNMINNVSASGVVDEPNWLHDGSATYTVTGDTINVLASMVMYGDAGVALNMPLTNVQSITFEYKGSITEGNDVKIWGGVCDDSKAYWEFGESYYVDGNWHTATAYMDQEYYHEGDSPEPLNASQLVVYANSESGEYTNYPFWVRYVRYHCEGDSAEVASIVVVRKYESKSANILDGEVVHTGMANNMTDDLSDMVGGTYYYTVYALDKDGVPSQGVTVSYLLEKTTDITLAYNATEGKDGQAVAKQGGEIQSGAVQPEGPQDFIIEGYCTTADCKLMVMNSEFELAKNIKGYTDMNGKWIYEKATCTLYTKWRDPLDCPAPTIDVHPTTDLIEQELGKTISFGLTSSDADTYQWCTSDEFGNNRTPIPGAAAQQATYTFTADKVGTYYYICEVKKDECRNVALSTVVSTLVYPAGLCIKYTTGTSQSETYDINNLTQKKEPEDDARIPVLEDWSTEATWTDNHGTKTHSPAWTAGSESAPSSIAFTFTIADGSYMTVTSVYASAKAASEDVTTHYYYVIADDQGHTFTSETVTTTTMGGVVDMPITSEEWTDLNFAGEVTFTIYAWSDETSNFRIGKYTQIYCTINTLPVLDDLSWTIAPQDGTQGGADAEIKAESATDPDAEVSYSTSDDTKATIVQNGDQYYVHYIGTGDVDIIASVGNTTTYSGTSISQKITIAPAVNIFDNGVVQGVTGDHRWETPTNWTTGEVPDIHQKAIIAADAVVTGKTASAKRVVIRTDASVTIQPTAALTVDGAIRSGVDYEHTLSATTPGQLIIESSALGNGALILDNTTADTKATVQYYSIASGAPTAAQWQWAATPYNDETDVQNNYYGAYICAWSDAIKNWKDYLHNGDGMSPFRAYCISRSAAGRFDMEGTLVSTDNPTLTITYNSSAAKGRYGLNLLGNSWTAPINVCQWRDEDFVNINPTIVILNTGVDSLGTGGFGSGPGQYISIPIHAASLMPGQLKVIPSMQGFQVRVATDAPASLTMNYKQLVVPDEGDVDIQPMRSPARRGTMWIRKKEITTLRLDVKGDCYSDFVYLFQHPLFTDEYDRGWDGEKILGSVEVPQLYVQSAAGKYAVSAQSELAGTQLAFYRGEDMAYTIRFTYDGDDELYLYDANTGIYTEIKNGNTYSFYSYTTSKENRFSITDHIDQQTIVTGIDQTTEDTQPEKYIDNDRLYIQINGQTYDGCGMETKRTINTLNY